MNRDFRYFTLDEDERETLVSSLREQLQEFDGISFAYLHGGFVERERFRDVDVAVWIRDIEEAWHFTVDVSARLEVSLGMPIDVQVLNEAPLPFKHRVFTEGVLLFSEEKAERLRVANLTIRMYWDLKLLRKYSIYEDYR